MQVFPRHYTTAELWRISTPPSPCRTRCPLMVEGEVDPDKSGFIKTSSALKAYTQHFL
jgi:hypothetical protein